MRRIAEKRAAVPVMERCYCSVLRKQETASASALTKNDANRTIGIQPEAIIIFT
jgi:hypothetical protein